MAAYAADRDHYREKGHLNYLKHREKAKERARRWWYENRERALERKRQYTEENRDLIRLRDKKYHANNADRINARTKAWRDANPEKVRALGLIDRSRRTRASGRATAQQIADRVAFYGGRCWMCGGPYEHLDHVIPVVRGGTNWPANLRPACADCNHRKGSNLPAFLQPERVAV